MVAHQQKKLDIDAVRELRDRFNIPVSDQDLADLPFRKPAQDSDEMRYLQTHRNAAWRLPAGAQADRAAAHGAAAGGVPLHPRRHGRARDLDARWRSCASSTCCSRTRAIGKHIVPIVPDEARTFGMEGPVPPDRHLLGGRTAVYAGGRRDPDVLPRGQARARCSRRGSTRPARPVRGSRRRPRMPITASAWCRSISITPCSASSASGTSSGPPAICARAAFLLGATAGRTTLAGEGLQHQDGHSQLVATTIPNCRAYDPTYAYELAVIIQDGMQRMYVENESVFYYISVMNENYSQPALPAGCGSGHCQGRLPAADAAARGKLRATLLGSGTILRECIAAAELLEQQFGVMRRRILDHEFQRAASRRARVRALESAASGRRAARALRAHACSPSAREPLVAATDYVRNVPDQIRPWVSQPYVTLGTDGFGRSDARAQLRQHFEVDRNFIALAALKALADASRIDRKTVVEAIAKLGIDAEQGRSSQQLSLKGIALASKDIYVPDLGDFKDVAVIEVLVQPGDSRAGRYAAADARDREGDHGRAVHGRRRHREASRRQRLAGLVRHPDRDAPAALPARGRRCRRRLRPAAAAPVAAAPSAPQPAAQPAVPPRLPRRARRRPPRLAGGECRCRPISEDGFRARSCGPLGAPIRA